MVFFLLDVSSSCVFDLGILSANLLAQNWQIYNIFWLLSPSLKTWSLIIQLQSQNSKNNKHTRASCWSRASHDNQNKSLWTTFEWEWLNQICSLLWYLWRLGHEIRNKMPPKDARKQNVPGDRKSKLCRWKLYKYSSNLVLSPRGAVTCWKMKINQRMQLEILAARILLTQRWW